MSPPVADFSTDDTLLYLPDAIASFTNLSQNASEYIWDFGDGATSSETSPAHYYSTTGYYTVSLTAKNQVCPDDEKEAESLIHVAIAENIQEQNLSFVISPNPFTNILTVNFSQDISQSPVFSLIDMSGKAEILKYSQKSNLFELHIPANIGAGVYMLRIQTSDKVYYKKIVKDMK